jgi:hypothetical protein
MTRKVDMRRGGVDVRTLMTRQLTHVGRIQGGNRSTQLGLPFVGGLFLVSAGVHIGIVSADAQQYRRFADGALPWVRTAWREVFMANPSSWGLAVAAGELAIGTAILAGGRWTRLGLVGAIAFHVALMLFGFGFWIWSLPMLVLLGALWQRSDSLRSDAPAGPQPPHGPNVKAADHG